MWYHVDNLKASQEKYDVSTRWVFFKVFEIQKLSDFKNPGHVSHRHRMRLLVNIFQ